MASSQCGNCGQVGHFRAYCPHPKSNSNANWHAAKRQFRREHPEERKKIKADWMQRKVWQEEGITISFYLLDKALSDIQQTLYEIMCDLDVMGRPNDWISSNKLLDHHLPFVKQLLNIGKGFVSNGRLKDLGAGADAFEGKLEDVEDRRDKLVYLVKSLVNGKLGKLAKVNDCKDPQALLCYVYAIHPPKTSYTFEESQLNASTLKTFLRKSLLHYHRTSRFPSTMNGKSFVRLFLDV